MTPTRRVFALFAALTASLAIVAGAGAEVFTRSDGQGRPITLDVRAQSVDFEWYAALLSWAAHGDEVSDVTVRIVPQEAIGDHCGGGALACYGFRRGVPTITVPAGTSNVIADTLLHEYGHHLDTAWDVPGVPELDGTPVWWSARGMADLYANGMVAFDYSRGWIRSVAEVFAEDYAYIHLGGSYAIPWLNPPDDALRAAMFAELGGAPTTAPPEAAAVPVPVVVTRTGRLAARRRTVVPFAVLGPGRHVTLTVNLSGSNRRGTRARVQVVCNGSVVGTRTFVRGQIQRTLDLPGLGPAECEARLVSTTRVALDYTLRLRVALET
jgi:hypothetical protein